ncbi:MAG: NAD-binding protein [Blastocatellia bacterium]|nr:NAD-binding protein [Blastocatellia bacterium]
MRSMDAGTIGGDDGNWMFLSAMLATTFGGIFIFSTLIGLLTAGIESQIEKLQKGRTLVVENNHTVILGWSAHVFTIISELIVASTNQKYSCVVILADKDKMEMIDEIRNKIGKNTGKLRIVCRTGNPMDILDLELVNLPGSKSIIVLGAEGDEQDAQVIKTLLAITNNPNRRKTPYHIVVELHNPRNNDIIGIIGANEIEVVQSEDIIARITAQTCRQSGLSVVYTDLLDFGGDEIYFQQEPKLVGKTFSDSLLLYNKAAIIGLQYKDNSVALNPPHNTVIKDGDKVIAIAEDDDKVIFSGLSIKIAEDVIVKGKKKEINPERTIILGWNKRASKIINELDNYVAQGSSLLVVAEIAEAEEEINQDCSELKNQTVSFRLGDTTDRFLLDELQMQSFNQIIVLCYSEYKDAQKADACTLMTLLHLRDIESKSKSNFAIVSEMMDVNNRELAKATNADDFIVSDRLISLLLTQISENKYLNPIFADIFDQDGSEISMKLANEYVLAGKKIDFYTVVESARRRGHIAIGYRIAAESQNADKAYGVRLNPDKSELVTFTEEDSIIVIAED